MKKKKLTFPAPLSSCHTLNSAKGPVTIRLTNDYLFRAFLQRNNKALKGLICALLHLKPEQVQSIVITNPIELGSSIDDKTFFLDVQLVLNNNIVINLEMQVINEHNWTERSLSYLCRAFDNLNPGEDYHNVKSAFQIGLLDFTLFPEHPEFYSTYEFLNIKNHTIYSDKLRLSVVDLTQINMATEEDKLVTVQPYGFTATYYAQRLCILPNLARGFLVIFMQKTHENTSRHPMAELLHKLHRIDYWAALFKATTWEEIRMLAQKDEYIREASDTIYQLSQEEKIRLQCEAREDYYRRQRSVQHYIEEQSAELQKKDSIIRRKLIRK